MENKKKMSFALVLVMICVILAAVGQVSMKKGITQVGELSVSDLFSSKLFTIGTNFYIFIGLIGYIISLGLWLVALSKLDISFMYPLVSIGYILTALFAFVFLKENVTLLRWVGIFLITTGCFLIIKT